MATSIQHSYYSPHGTFTHRQTVSADAHIVRARARYKEFVDAVETTHTCVTCKQQYTPLQNYNSYFCFVHLGYLNRWGFWECCNQSKFANGCVPSIHFRQEEQKLEVITFPQKIMNVPSELVDLGIIKINTKIFTKLYTPDALEDCYQMYCLKQE